MYVYLYCIYYSAFILNNNNNNNNNNPFIAVYAVYVSVFVYFKNYYLEVRFYDIIDMLTTLVNGRYLETSWSWHN